jgi:hypothetical protein
MQKVSDYPNTKMDASLGGQYLNLYYIFVKDASFESKSTRRPSAGTGKSSSYELIMAAEV